MYDIRLRTGNPRFYLPLRLRCRQIHIQPDAALRLALHHPAIASIGHKCRGQFGRSESSVKPAGIHQVCRNRVARGSRKRLLAAPLRRSATCNCVTVGGTPGRGRTDRACSGCHCDHGEEAHMTPDAYVVLSSTLAFHFAFASCISTTTAAFPHPASGYAVLRPEPPIQRSRAAVRVRCPPRCCAISAA